TSFAEEPDAFKRTEPDAFSRRGRMTLSEGRTGDTKGCGIAQRYYQTSIVSGCDAPLDHMSSNVKLDGKDKPQYGQIGHLAMVPAKAPFRTYVGLSSTLHGQSVRYGEKHEPRLKYSERSDLQAGSAPCTDLWTAVYHSLLLQKDLS
ncbi:hypothetical protein IGI04_019242, partial [Brassica rapa subsp. trilocularis]